jgi:DNA polymerase I
MRFVNAYWRGNSIIAFARNDEGEIERRAFPAEHSFFVRTKDLLKVGPTGRILKQVLHGSRLLVGISNEGEYSRIRWTYERPRGKPPLHVLAAQWVENEFDVPTFEADINPIRRWSTDHKIEIDKPTRAYFDIETDSRVPFSRKQDARILAWALVGEDGRVDSGVLEHEDDESERALLRAMWRAFMRYDSILAWNGDRFDFPMIEDRTATLGLRVDYRRWLFLDHLLVYRRLNVAAASGDEKQSMALNAVAQQVTGQAKHDVDASKSYEEWLANPQRLLAYCVQDAELMRQIENKTGFVALLQSLCEATHVFPDTRGLNPTAQVEGFLMRLALEHGHRFPTWFRDEALDADKFKGAFVLHPTTDGIQRDVHVADFSKLYPSIILTWNMSPETYRPKVRLVEDISFRPSYLSHLPAKTYPLPEGHCISAITDKAFVNEPRGLLPIALEEMIRLRKYWNTHKATLPPGTPEWIDADRKSTAYKVAANSFYGVVGSPFSRFFVRDVAESVTQCGVWLIQETIKAAEARGMRVVYGDTDSIFVVGASREEFEAFTAWCNAELYPGLIASKSCTRNEVELAYEKAFERIVMTRAKRYVGRYLHYKGTDATEDSEPEIKGLEYKRGDVPKLARVLQHRVIEILLTGPVGSPPPTAEEFVGLLDEWKSKILEGELAKGDVIQSKRLSRSLGMYSRAKKKDGTWSRQPPHIEVARMLKERGRDVGEGVKIEYFVADAGGDGLDCKPADDWNGEFDRHYVWEKLVFPPTQRLLVAGYPEFDWAPWERTRPSKKYNPDQGLLALDEPEKRPARPKRSTASKSKPKPVKGRKKRSEAQRSLNFGKAKK